MLLLTQNQDKISRFLTCGKTEVEYRILIWKPCTKGRIAEPTRVPGSVPSAAGV